MGVDPVAESHLFQSLENFCYASTYVDTIFKLEFVILLQVLKCCM
jgi:hypothetical protein